MNLNHINLTSFDIPGDRAMFETYFGMTCLLERGESIALLKDKAGMTLVLSHFAKKLGGFAYPDEYDVHHVGFMLETREEVDAMNGRLVADGWDASAPRAYHGAWTFYFKAKGGYFIEVGHQERPI